MRILHLFSNWKWTGPAEPAVNLCRELSNRHDVVFICGSPHSTDLENEIVKNSLERGVTPLEGFRLTKHISVRANFLDWLKLRKMLKSERFDIIHTHLPNDHLVAGVAQARLKRKPLIVRSFYGTEGPEPIRRNAFLLNRFTSGAIVITDLGMDKLTNRYQFPGERSALIPVGIDTERFDAGRFERARCRPRFGLGQDDFVLGIVARMQRHRKFEILIKAMKRAMAAAPGLKLLIVGRGTYQEEVAQLPVKELGLEDRVFFTGYLSGDDYVKALAAMDAAFFLVPGSDGSCRAVREKMAMGLPMIASDIPPLNEMVIHNKTGFLVEPTEEGLARGALDMARQPDQTAAMGKAALEFARHHFSLTNQAELVEAFYRRLIETGEKT